MTKAKKNTATAQEPAELGTKPFREDGPAPLPEFKATEHSSNGSLFVQFEQPGDTFTGVFIRRVEANTEPEGLEYPGYLFASYPDGDLSVLPMTWAIQQEMEKQEENGRKLDHTVIRLTLDKIKKLDEGTRKERTVKLFHFGYMTLTGEQLSAFLERVTFTDQFPG